MNMERKARERALRRRNGMSKEAQARLSEFNQTQIYHGHCRICQTRMSSTLDEFITCPSCGATTDVG